MSCPPRFGMRSRGAFCCHGGLSPCGERITIKQMFVVCDNENDFAFDMCGPSAQILFWPNPGAVNCTITALSNTTITCDFVGNLTVGPLYAQVCAVLSLSLLPACTSSSLPRFHTVSQ